MINLERRIVWVNLCALNSADQARGFTRALIRTLFQPLQFTRGVPIHHTWSLHLKGVRADMISHLFKVFKGIIISPVLQRSK